MDIFELIRQGKIKRYFRVRNKISYPGAICHITQRAPGCESLFIEDGDYLYMFYLIKNKSKEFNFKMLSFILMPNHLHLLIQLIQNNLSSAMRNIFREYALYFNQKYERKGHVFCGRFRQALCFDDSYLLASSIYIHINPIAAGLVKNALDYRWSSIIPFVQEFKKETFVDYKLILELLDEDIGSARGVYRELLDQAINIKQENLWDNPKALEAFRNKFANFLKKLATHLKQAQPSQTIDLEIEAIKNKKYKKDLQTHAARKYLVEQLRAKGYKNTEIAQKLNLTRQAIHKILNTQ